MSGVVIRHPLRLLITLNTRSGRKEEIRLSGISAVIGSSEDSCSRLVLDQAIILSIICVL